MGRRRCDHNPCRRDWGRQLDGGNLRVCSRKTRTLSIILCPHVDWMTLTPLPWCWVKTKPNQNQSHWLVCTKQPTLLLVKKMSYDFFLGYPMANFMVVCLPLRKWIWIHTPDTNDPWWPHTTQGSHDHIPGPSPMVSGSGESEQRLFQPSYHSAATWAMQTLA